MKASRVSLPFFLCVLSACAGVIDDPTGMPASEGLTFSPADLSQDDAAGAKADQPEPEADGGAARLLAAPAPVAELTAPAAEAAAPVAQAAAQPAAASATTSVGTGEMNRPAMGPAPIEAAKIPGDPFVLVKNWDFGKRGTVKNAADLQSEFQFHDHFGTIANGTNYGSVTVAPNEETAISAPGLGLPNDRQPVEDPANPLREFTDDTLLAHVRPLSDNQSTFSAWKHDTGNGSLTAKWKLDKGGSLLGRDLVWETRVRMPKPVPGYWFALWTAGQHWDKGAEMDVLESFGTPNINADAFHADSVGGKNEVEYKAWPNALDSVGVPANDRALSDWHTWTWVYLRDDTFQIYYDGHLVQHGSIPWTYGASQGGEPVDMYFLFDFSWGHTQVQDVNIELPVSALPLTYEIDYSRVYMR
jgi:hypothetical protein